MEDYYENIKEDQGIEINYALLESDRDFDAAFKQMRPNYTGSFSEYLRK